jgi:DNA repair photolyase
MTKRLTGTREWADITLNFQRGCEYGCAYCYAHARAARFKQVPEGGWTKPVPTYPKAAMRKVIGSAVPLRVMMPSTHDITMDNVRAIAFAARDVLTALCRHTVLLVSKPRFRAIATLTGDNVVYANRDSIMFRFTLGSLDDKVLKLMEPGAPGVAERLACIGLAVQRGFRVTVSAEPLLCLTHCDAFRLILVCTLLGAEKVWVGPMNHAAARLTANGATPEQKAHAAELRVNESPWWRVLREQVEFEPKLKRVVLWKDAALKLIGLPERTERSKA